MLVNGLGHVMSIPIGEFQRLGAGVLGGSLLEPRKALRNPSSGGKRAEVGGIERRVPFGEIDQADLGLGGELSHPVIE